MANRNVIFNNGDSLKPSVELRIDLSNWLNDFPELTPYIDPDDDKLRGYEIHVGSVKFKGIEVCVGDMVEHKSPYAENSETTILKIDCIRLYPTMRFWNQEIGAYFAAANCTLIKKPIENIFIPPINLFEDNSNNQ